MDQPKVSLIISAHNETAFIAKTIQSVLNQTYENFKLIVVDVVSTDNTTENVNGFTDQRVICIRQEKTGDRMLHEYPGFRHPRAE